MQDWRGLGYAATVDCCTPLGNDGDGVRISGAEGWNDDPVIMAAACARASAAALAFRAGRAEIDAEAPDAEDPVCVQECLDAMTAGFRRNGQLRAGGAGDIQRFDVDEETCTTPHAEGPEVTAMVVAPFYEKFLHLPGTQNDAKLWEDLLRRAAWSRPSCMCSLAMG